MPGDGGGGSSGGGRRRAVAAAARSDLVYGDNRCPITLTGVGRATKRSAATDRPRKVDKNAAGRQIALPIC